MTGIYLKCDSCGKTLGGEDVESDFNRDSLHWTEWKKLQEYARRKGWTGPLTKESDTDKCPECSALWSSRER